MNEKSKKNFIIAGGLFLLFLLFTIAVMKVDVEAIGPKGSFVGLAGINGFFFEKIGVHAFWDTVTDLLLGLSFLVVLAFGVLGISQLVKRKSLWKVDNGILMLAVFYVFVAAFYLLFEVVIVNYRPVLEDGELAASFPSSHTMLVCCIVGTAMIQLYRMLEQKSMRLMIEIVGGIVILLAIVGRMLAGVHWFTDVLGGVLLSAALVMLYYAAVSYLDDRQEK